MRELLRRLFRTPTWEPLEHRPVPHKVAAQVTMTYELICDTPGQELPDHILGVLARTVEESAEKLDRHVIATTAEMSVGNNFAVDTVTVRLTATTAWNWRTGGQATVETIREARGE